METRRFPAPWSIEDTRGVLHCPRRQRAGVGHLYYNDEEHQRSVNKRLTKDEARQIAENVAKLPELMRGRLPISEA